MIKKLVLVIIAEILLLGCSTTEFKTYKTLRATQTAVVATMETYRDLYNAGEIDARERAEVKAMYERYQRLFNSALVAAEFDYKSATPIELAGHVSTLILIVDAL